MGKWTKKMNRFVKAKDKAIKKMYFFYTTCPACPNIYGKNYAVILVEVWILQDSTEKVTIGLKASKSLSRKFDQMSGPHTVLRFLSISSIFRS